MMHIWTSKRSQIKKFVLQSYKSRGVLQLWYKVRLHRTSYEKVIKFSMQSIIAGSNHKLAMMTHITNSLWLKPIVI
jgi:hypothetical protein